MLHEMAEGVDPVAGAGNERVAADPAAPLTAALTVDLAEYNWQAHSVLVVDDEEGMRNFLERTLARRCGMVQSAADAEHAAALMARLHFDLLILDIALPGKSGIEWLHELREHGYTGDVILVTAFADMETAIDALRGGASDFILKPFRVDQILNSIKRCFERARLTRENFVLRRELAGLAADPIGLVGHSAAIEQLRAMVRRVGQMPSTVLLQGESGTGKEIVARALHQTSPRAQRPFVPVNCAAIASELIESELFGHVKGAFTGASESRNGLFYYAHGGTLFLDEISELPLALQTRLLRVLEERKLRPVGSEREVPVDVRIIAATNRKLAAEVKAGRFREDLLPPGGGRTGPAAAACAQRRHSGSDAPLHAATCGAVGRGAAAAVARGGEPTRGLPVAGQRARAAQLRRALDDPGLLPERAVGGVRGG